MLTDTPIDEQRHASGADAVERPMVLHPRVVTGAGGGPDKTVLTSPRYLRALGYDATCLYLRPPEDAGFAALRERAERWAAPLEEIDDRGALDWRVVPRALEVCRRLDVRVWHGHDYKTNLLGLLLRRRRAMTLVTTVHGWVHHTARTPLYYRLDQWALRHYERVVCVSPDLLEQCRAMGVRAERSMLIENAIDCEQFRRTRTRLEAKRRLGLQEDGLLIGAVGRLSREKGFDLLIRAVAQLRQLVHDVRLVIIGEGDQRSALEELIQSQRLADRVLLAGFQSNTADWFEAMDVFALSSLREGLPNVVLEAMAMETPVVATRVAGVPRVIEDGVSGLIVPIGDQAALAGAIARVLSDANLGVSLAEQARRVIETRYSFAARMEKMVAVYQELGVEPGRRTAELTVKPESGAPGRRGNAHG